MIRRRWNAAEQRNQPQLRLRRTPPTRALRRVLRAASMTVTSSPVGARHVTQWRHRDDETPAGELSVCRTHDLEGYLIRASGVQLIRYEQLAAGLQLRWL